MKEVEERLLLDGIRVLTGRVPVLQVVYSTVPVLTHFADADRPGKMTQLCAQRSQRILPPRSRGYGIPSFIVPDFS